MNPSIVVVGSLNADLVVRVDRFPASGETLRGSRFDVFAGGKGGNQAAAAARLGGHVAMAGQVGGDAYGTWLRASLEATGVDVACVSADDAVSSGVALITTDAAGQNTIVVVAGANGTFTPDRLAPAATLIRQATVVLLQLEIPMATVERAAAEARTAGAMLLLDPAPATEVPDQLLALASLVTPNESELAALASAPLLDGPTPDDEIDSRAGRLIARGAGAVLVKLGARGARLVTPSRRTAWPAFPVEVVDTTAAGDAFNGALAVALAGRAALDDAIRFACAAGALSVTRAGAQPSMPTREEVERAPQEFIRFSGSSVHRFAAHNPTHMPIKVALIGTGKIAVANHIPGIGFCRDAAVVALSDPNPAALAEASAVTGVTRTYADPFALLKDAPVDAVIVATPNRFHRELVVAAADSGRHVLCEKPLALSVAEANEMVVAAERAGVRHMTAFTYRFVPAMQYMHHLVTSGAIGTPWHFRAQRFQDWDRRAIGWRQRLSEAGSGEIGDMLSHRLDFAHFLVGPMRRVTALTSQIWPTRVDEAGIEHPSDTEDWVGCLAEFASGVTGVFESVKTATGYAGGVTSRDFCEVNGSDGAVIYELSHPLRVLRAGKGGNYSEEAVPPEFRKIAGSPRDSEADAWQGFRYDQDFEFIEAIHGHRACRPSFIDGLRVQEVMAAIQTSAAEHRAVGLEGHAGV